MKQDHLIQQLIRRPAAAVALCIIGVTCLISIFAYLLAPDDTPSANRMIVELSARPVGFTTQVLHIPIAQAPQSINIIRTWFLGKPATSRLLPINSSRFDGGRIIIRHYIDDDLEDTLSYPIAQLMPQELHSRPQSEQQQYIASHNISTLTFHLGTDRYGRDILSRLLVGSRVTLLVGFVAVLLSLTIGIVLGALAGYYGGVVDKLVMWVINIIYAIPTLLLVFAITLALGKGFIEIFIAIGLSMWIGTARLVRGQVMVLREMEYVAAARVSGLGDMRILFRHILPNIAGPVIVMAASNFATAILIEAGLSFLGFGVQPPAPSWGLMIKEHYNFLLTNRPLLALIPGMAIMLLVYSFNILGNALRDILDVKS